MNVGYRNGEKLNENMEVVNLEVIGGDGGSSESGDSIHSFSYNS